MSNGRGKTMWQQEKLEYNIRSQKLKRFFCTYRCDDWHSQFFPVEDELSFIFNLYVLDEFA